MSNFPQKAKISTPNRRYKHQFRNFHETTTGFMLPNVPFFFPIEGKTSVNMDFDDFNRLNPMPIPTMGEATIKLAWYFVPRRIIFNRSKEFMTETIVHGLSNNRLYITNAPNFKYHDLFKRFTQQVLLHGPRLSEEIKDANNQSITIDQTNYVDFFGDNATTPADFISQDNPYKFTSIGIQVATILQQLGYPISSKLVGEKDNPTYVNAEPILAFCKVMLDHYIPRYWDAYTNNFTNLYNILESIDNYDLSRIGNAWIEEFIQLCTLVCYNDDYFTCAWNNPAGPNTTNPFTIGGISGTIDTALNINEVFALLKPTLGAGGVPIIAQQDLNTLKAVDKYLKKNQIAGTKYWDRMLANFGITTDKALIRVSEKIKEEKYPIIFNPVVSNAETKNGNTGDNLGSYAGIGEAGLQGVSHFEFTAQEFGYIIAIKTIVPEVAYSNAADAILFKLKKWDWYNEPFDAKGAGPINALELYSGYDLIAQENITSIWGFLPQYAWLKSMKNKVTGKLSVPSLRAEFEKWTFLRFFSKENFSVANSIYNVQVNPGFQIGYSYSADRLGSSGMSQFDRIFYTPSEHNFYCYTAFYWDMKTLLKPLYDYEDIIEDDEKEINISVGNKND